MTENDPQQHTEQQQDDFTVKPAPPRDREEIQEARSLVPAGAQRIAPVMTLTQQIEFAQAMAKAVAAVPEAFRGNVGDCLAIVDIALRADLSPYMLAGKCYVEPKSGRIAMESQAYHALVQTPGILIGDLTHEYEGDGENLVCIVRGVLRSDPHTVREHRSEPLHKARPKRNEQGTVRGSPLWDKKPRVQLFYDTSRDWVRIYAPRATLGIYTPDELEEYAEHFGADAAKDVTGAQLKERLNGADRSEGHKAGHVETEIANLGTGKITILPAKKDDKSKRKRFTGKRKKGARDPEQSEPVTQEEIDSANKIVEQQEAAERQQHGEQAKPEPKPSKPKGKKDQPAPIDMTWPPKDAAGYVAQARIWIEKTSDPEEALKRWSDEADMRDNLVVRIPDRQMLRALLEKKHGV